MLSWTDRKATARLPRELTAIICIYHEDNCTTPYFEFQKKVKIYVSKLSLPLPPHLPFTAHCAQQGRILKKKLDVNNTSFSEESYDSF